MAPKESTRRLRHASKKHTRMENDLAAMKIEDSAPEHGSGDSVVAGNASTDDTNTVDAGREKPFCLLNLPDELILRILESTVNMSTRKHPIEIRAIPVDEAPFWWSYPQLEPAITRVCRSLRKEGLKTFYEMNHFLVKASTRGPNALCRWIDPLGEDGIKGVANLFVEWDPRDGDLDKEIARLRVVESRVSLKTKTFVRSIKAKEGKKPRYQMAYGQPKEGGDKPNGAGDWTEVVKNKKQN
ncbi:hypothetical protein BST61_g2044 [Cercospora zeina]